MTPYTKEEFKKIKVGDLVHGHDRIDLNRFYKHRTGKVVKIYLGSRNTGELLLEATDNKHHTFDRRTFYFGQVFHICEECKSPDCLTL